MPVRELTPNQALARATAGAHLIDIRAAHERLESNETFGKIVLRVTSEKQ